MPLTELVRAALEPLPIPAPIKSALALLAGALGTALANGADERELERRAQMLSARLARVQASKKILDWRKP